MHHMKVKMIRLCSWRKEQSGEKWKKKREIKMSQMDCLMVKKIPLSRIFGEEICQNSERVPAILCTH
jgi:hypothetical protein